MYTHTYIYMYVCIFIYIIRRLGPMYINYNVCICLLNITHPPEICDKKTKIRRAENKKSHNSAKKFCDYKLTNSAKIFP